MGRIVVTEYVSVDGIVEAPSGTEPFERVGWTDDFSRGPEGDKFKLDETMASDALLLGRWIAARVRMTLRSPRALGFTFAFPLVLVTLFGAINGDVKVPMNGVDVPFTQYYTPAIGVVMPGPLKLGAALFMLVSIVYVPLAKGEPPSDVNSPGLSG